ncbi:MAG: DEAD/DEAH box helicase [Chloroflexota bacterium]
MDSAAFLEHLTTETDYQGQIVHVEHIPPRGAVYAQPDEPLAAAVEACLRQHRMWPLYLHQALAVDHLKRGEQVMVATASASGKTLCYHVPVLESVVIDRQSTALYLFPTKALAQDQRRGLEELFCPALLKPGDFATFDGDTPGEERAVVRQKARIVLTNPDMLHVGILPNHQSWSRLLANLKYVVVDEAHTYRGVFGSHVAGVLRRLRRLCRQYGAAPQFIACSATIANPGEHAARLVGLPFTVVAEDGSPQGGRDFVFWNPPLIDAAKSRRGSANSEATHLFTELVHGHIRTLTFARTRRLTELIYRYAQDRLEGMAP